MLEPTGSQQYCRCRLLGKKIRIAIVREANNFYRGLGKNIWHDIRSVLAGKPTILRVYELAGTYIGNVNFEANNFYRVLGKYTN